MNNALQRRIIDGRYWQLNGNQQLELIAKHCVDIEDRIRSAPSRLKALRLKELACSRFEQTCSSALVRAALSKHVEGLISHYWDKKQL